MEVQGVVGRIVTLWAILREYKEMGYNILIKMINRDIRIIITVNRHLHIHTANCSRDSCKIIACQIGIKN